MTLNTTAALKHHHLLFQGRVGIEPETLDEEDLLIFLQDFLKTIGMNCLIQPQVRLSHQNAWTGIMGIITSHIAFHYWVDEKYLQLDIYSCKEFDRIKTIDFLEKFWKMNNSISLFIDREIGKNFQIERIGTEKQGE